MLPHQTRAETQRVRTFKTLLNYAKKEGFAAKDFYPFKDFSFTVCSPTAFSLADCTDEEEANDCVLGNIQNTLWFQFVATTTTTATVIVAPDASSDFIIGAH